MPRRREGPRKDKKHGFFVFDEIVGYGDDRSRVRFSLRTKDPAKARWLWEQEYRKHWSEYYGLKPPPIHAKNILFIDLADEFIDYQRNVKKTNGWQSDMGRLRIMCGLWKGLKVDGIDKSRLVELDSHLRGMGRSESTINHYMSLLGTLFNYALRENKFQGKNPASEMKPYLIASKRREYGPEELGRIIEAAGRIEREARPQGEVMRCAKSIVLLLVYTGMRAGELLNLKWENVGNDKIVLKRTETKQRKEKIIPLTPGVRDVLEGLKERRKDEFVLPLRRRDKTVRYKPGWTIGLTRKIRELTGIEDFILHNLRHTASSIMVSEALGKGVGIADIMEILGHSKVETTLQYLHSDFSRMRKAMRILERKAKDGKAKKA